MEGIVAKITSNVPNLMKSRRKIKANREMVRAYTLIHGISIPSITTKLRKSPIFAVSEDGTPHFFVFAPDQVLEAFLTGTGHYLDY
jgi:hypothetical protein